MSPEHRALIEYRTNLYLSLQEGRAGDVETNRTAKDWHGQRKTLVKLCDAAGLPFGQASRHIDESVAMARPYR